MAALDLLDDWPVDHAAATVVVAGVVTDTTGDVDAVFALASITKLITAMATLVAHEEGTLPLDEPVTAAGATTADLLAHAAGLAPDTPDQMTDPHRRRIYSTSAYDAIAAAVATRSAMPFREYAALAVLDPLGMTATVLDGSAGAGARSSVRDLTALVGAWRAPVLVDSSTLTRAITPHRGELAGVLPGYGRHDPNPWGLGPEIRGHKDPHWTGDANSPRTYGHFGQAGTCLWIDPEPDVALIALTDRPFGDWAIAAWPPLANAVLRAHGSPGPEDPVPD